MQGSFAVYLEPWHADVFSFLDLRKNHGNELERARYVCVCLCAQILKQRNIILFFFFANGSDLFLALWIPDLFMQRVEANGQWSLFCPNEAPGLFDVWGDEFKTLYER